MAVVGSALARTVKLQSPTKLVVDPPDKQVVGKVSVCISEWSELDRLVHKTFGATTDHVILHGTCNTWTWAPDDLPPARRHQASVGGIDGQTRPPPPVAIVMATALAFVHT